MKRTRKFNPDSGIIVPDPESQSMRLARLRANRAQKATEDLKRWQSKFKRARKMVSKLKARVKYYDGQGMSAKELAARAPLAAQMLADQLPSL
mgnify:CR=1 FL=1